MLSQSLKALWYYVLLLHQLFNIYQRKTGTKLIDAIIPQMHLQMSCFNVNTSVDRTKRSCKETSPWNTNITKTVTWVVVMYMYAHRRPKAWPLQYANKKTRVKSSGTSICLTGNVTVFPQAETTGKHMVWNGFLCTQSWSNRTVMERSSPLTGTSAF